MAIEKEEYRSYKGTILDIKLENQDCQSMRRKLLGYAQSNFISHNLHVNIGPKVESNPSYAGLRSTVDLLNRTANRTAARDMVITISEK